MGNRREFLFKSAAALAMASAGPGVRPAWAGGKDRAAAKPLRLLMIGGAGFVGSNHVRAAVARGHAVTVLDRSAKNRNLPAEAEILVGDRFKDLKLLDNREWDAVIDLAAFAPHAVRTLADVLKGRIRHYTLISTVAVYQHPNPRGVLGENSPLLTYTGSGDPYSLTFFRTGEEYGSLKVLCEKETEKQFPGGSLILRPGYIAGPGEHQGQFAYWTLRMDKGGEVLVAGEPSTPVQFIDVRDLADWCIGLVEKRATGIYNATGPAGFTTLSQFIDAARSPGSPSSKMTWVPASWLAAQDGGKVWNKLLYWSLEADNWGWAMQMNIERALASGLALRPMNDTRKDAVNGYLQQPAEHRAKLLSVSWPEYLEREKAILAAWRAQHPDPS